MEELFEASRKRREGELRKRGSSTKQRREEVEAEAEEDEEVWLDDEQPVEDIPTLAVPVPYSAYEKVSRTAPNIIIKPSRNESNSPEPPSPEYDAEFRGARQRSQANRDEAETAIPPPERMDINTLLSQWTTLSPREIARGDDLSK
jgi:hypothetical protein